MRAGPLRHRVTVQEKGPVTRSATGEEQFTWANVATTWADVRDLSGREFLRGTQQGADITVVVEMRYRNLTPANRIVFGDRTFDIEQVLNHDGRKRVLEALCREAVR